MNKSLHVTAFTGYTEEKKKKLRENRLQGIVSEWRNTNLATSHSITASDFSISTCKMTSQPAVDRTVLVFIASLKQTDIQAFI